VLHIKDVLYITCSILKNCCEINVHKYPKMQPPVAVKNVKFALGGTQFEHKEPDNALDVEARAGAPG
jgi:hypothetical protein